MKWGVWLKGLIAGIVQGLATGITTYMAYPDLIKISEWGKIVAVIGLSGLVGAALYLKQSPIPLDDTTTK